MTCSSAQRRPKANESMSNWTRKIKKARGEKVGRMTWPRLGTWTVLWRAPHVKGQNGVRWAARHSCGVVWVLPGFELRLRLPNTCPSCRNYRKVGTRANMVITP